MKNNFFDMIEKNYNIKLNNQQREAVLHKDGPAIILAVPGAGKTTVLICRTANLIINHKVNPENILSVTFSKASALDMTNRFNSLFSELAPNGIKFSTIHSFAYNLVREYAYMTRTKYTIIEGENAGASKIAILKKLYHKANDAYISEDKLEELISSIGYVKNMMLAEEDFKKHNFNVPGFRDIYREYEGLKRENNLLDFDDMLTRAYEILLDNQSILEKYRNKYRYIQVDEGQDTSKIQHEIIGLLGRPNNNIFLVGDEDQSIYGFRGAYPEAILRFEKVYKNARVFLMEENFRSTRNIVSLSNEFIKSNRERYDKNLFTNRLEGEPVIIKNLNDEGEEVNFLIEEIKKCDDPKGTAILYRNNLSAISIIDAFNRNNIDFYVRDFKQTFFKHWVVLDIIAFLSLTLNNEDINAFERIYYKMNSYLPKKAIEFIKESYKGESVFNLLRKYPGLSPYQLKRINTIEGNFRLLSYKKPIYAIEFIEKELNYWDYIFENSERLGYSIENLNLIIAAMKLIAKNTETIVGFLNRINELQDIIDRAKFSKGKGVITLSTVHSSKGLEFDDVYMIDLIEGQFPSTNTLKEDGEDKGIEEERRLFYVGMTRARNRLNLISVTTKNDERVICSRFVGEVFGIISPPEETMPGELDINIGDNVNHKSFGCGKVIFIDRNIIEVYFDRFGIKKLMLDTCIEGNILEIKKAE